MIYLHALEFWYLVKGDAISMSTHKHRSMHATDSIGLCAHINRTLDVFDAKCKKVFIQLTQSSACTACNTFPTFLVSSWLLLSVVFRTIYIRL